MSGVDEPLVSVIMPYYNGQEYITEAVGSILDQTYKNIEIVIVDDASPDVQASEYIERFSEEVGFKLIKHQLNKGIGQTMADAVEASGGEYIAELSQDDLYKPEKIATQVKELRSKGLDAVYAVGDVLIMESGRLLLRDQTKTKQLIETGVAADWLRLQNLSCISIQGLLAKRSVFEKDIVPIWRDYLLDDWPVNARLFEKYNVGYIDKPLWTGRNHSDQTSCNVWKWLGPQVEVASRMAPDELRAESIGNRVASMARRLHKQKVSRDAIARFAFASLMLTESGEAYKKASRVLNKIPFKDRKVVTQPILRLVGNAGARKDTPLSEACGDVNFQTLGKEIANVVGSFQGRERLNRIGRLFSSLAFNLMDSSRLPTELTIKYSLASLMLTDDPELMSETSAMLLSAQPGCKQLIEDKCRVIKAKSRRNGRYLWTK